MFVSWFQYGELYKCYNTTVLYLAAAAACGMASTGGWQHGNNRHHQSTDRQEAVHSHRAPVHVLQSQTQPTMISN